METEIKSELRRREGCISVEMESSGLQSICDYYELELYTFFFPADVLENSFWLRENLGGEVENNIQIEMFNIALKIAIEI